MKVFKLYFQIIIKKVSSIIAYVVAFMLIISLFAGANTSSTSEFEVSKVSMAVINHDEDTELITHMLTYLEQYAWFVEVEEHQIQDALYFREIYVAIIIPEGFTESYLAGEAVTIGEASIPDAATSISPLHILNRYLHLIRVYQEKLDGSLLEILDAVQSDLSHEVSATRTTSSNNRLYVVEAFYNYLSYLFFAVIISIMAIVILRIKKLDVKRRMAVSSYPDAKSSFELMLGHIVFSIVLCLVMVGLSFLFYPEEMNSKNGLLFALNALALSLAFVSMGYVLSLLIKKENAIQPVVNLLSLGGAFVSGAFVPQFLLDNAILTIAHVLPNFYFIRNNNRIRYLTVFSNANLSPIIMDIVIQLGFAIVFAFIGILLSQKLNRSEQ